MNLDGFAFLTIAFVLSIFLCIMALFFYPPRILTLLKSFLRCWRKGYLSVVNFADKKVVISYSWEGKEWHTKTHNGYREKKYVSI